MNSFARDITVHQRFREARREIARCREGSEMRRKGECRWAFRSERHPTSAAPQFVAGTFDEYALWGEGSLELLPSRCDCGLVVLPQDVHRPNNDRPQTGNIEAAMDEADAGNLISLNGPHPIAVVLDTDDVHVGTYRT